MSAAANKRLIHRFITEVLNTGKLDAFSEFVAEQLIDHNADPVHSAGIEG